MIRTLLLTAAAVLAIAPAAEAKPKKAPNPLAPPTYTYAAPTAPIAASVMVPAGYSTVYLSGMVPDVVHPDAEKGSIASYGTTEEQTESVLAKLKAALVAQGVDFKDVVSMHVFLAGDPAMGGKMDFAGMMKSYTKHFGTPDQPNRPVRATVQVAALAAPGFLVEIEVVAVKPAS